MPSYEPPVGYPSPTLDQPKESYYKDFPLVYNATVTNKPFYLDFDCTICTDNIANTTLQKWDGANWVNVSGLVSPDIIVGRGYFAVTTAVNAYVTLTEHVDE